MSSKISFEALQTIGQRKAAIEREVLFTLRDGFGVIELLDSPNFDELATLAQGLNLAEYTQLSKGLNALKVIQQNSVSNAEMFLHWLIVLDRLVALGQVKRELWVKQKGGSTPSQLKEKFNGDGCLQANWLVSSEEFADCLSKNTSDKNSQSTIFAKYRGEARGEAQANHFDVFLCGVTYTLLTKGYDDAIKFQEHKDHEDRFQQQKDLSESALAASQASKSISEQALSTSKESSKTAKRALLIASLIAIGSIGNLGFGVYKYINGPYDEQAVVTPQPIKPKPFDNTISNTSESQPAVPKSAQGKPNQ